MKQIRGSIAVLMLNVILLLSGCSAIEVSPHPKNLLSSEIVSPPSTRTDSDAPYSAWVQLGPSGIAITRAIVLAPSPNESPSCPFIELLWRGVKITEQMSVRAKPYYAPSEGTATSFQALVCEFPIPTGTTFVSVGGTALPLPKPNPQTIVVIGDTGCRITAWMQQACNEPNRWPFATVAAEAAALTPDLVIHVGDYHYRHTPCPSGGQGCEGSPYGYNWASWDADFFRPAAPLLAQAPWVFIRGNHEMCGRASHGRTSCGEA